MNKNNELAELVSAQEADQHDEDQQYERVRTEQEARTREQLIDYTEAAAKLGMAAVTDRKDRTGVDERGSDKVPVGSEFTSRQVWDLGDGVATSGGGGSSGRYRPSQELSDLVSVGHGFTIDKFSNPDTPEVCRICGNKLGLFDPSFECEFSGAPMNGCRCNACECNRRGIRQPGRPATICHRKACKDERNRRKARKSRKRKKRVTSIP